MRLRPPSLPLFPRHPIPAFAAVTFSCRSPPQVLAGHRHGALARRHHGGARLPPCPRHRLDLRHPPHLRGLPDACSGGWCLHTWSEDPSKFPDTVPFIDLSRLGPHAIGKVNW